MCIKKIFNNIGHLADNIKVKYIIIFISFFIISCGEKSLLDFDPNTVTTVIEPQNSITQVNANMANRTYVSSVLKSAFYHGSLPNAAILSQIDWGVISRSSDFGGPCTFNDDDAFCNPNQLNNVYIPMMAGSSTGRQGFKVRVCENLVGINDAVYNFVENAKENSSISTDPLEQAYMVFYPGQTLQPLISEHLLRLLVSASNEIGGESFTESTIVVDLNNTTSQFQGWKYVALTLCISNGWEQL